MENNPRASRNFSSWLSAELVGVFKTFFDHDNNRITGVISCMFYVLFNLCGPTKKAFRATWHFINRPKNLNIAHQRITEGKTVFSLLCYLYNIEKQPIVTTNFNVKILIVYFYEVTHSLTVALCVEAVAGFMHAAVDHFLILKNLMRRPNGVWFINPCYCIPIAAGRPYFYICSLTFILCGVNFWGFTQGSVVQQVWDEN